MRVCVRMRMPSRVCVYCRVRASVCAWVCMCVWRPVFIRTAYIVSPFFVAYLDSYTGRFFQLLAVISRLPHHIHHVDFQFGRSRQIHHSRASARVCHPLHNVLTSSAVHPSREPCGSPTGGGKPTFPTRCPYSVEPRSSTIIHVYVANLYETVTS